MPHHVPKSQIFFSFQVFPSVSHHSESSSSIVLSHTNYLTFLYLLLSHYIHMASCLVALTSASFKVPTLSPRLLVFLFSLLTIMHSSSSTLTNSISISIGALQVNDTNADRDRFVTRKSFTLDALSDRTLCIYPNLGLTQKDTGLCPSCGCIAKTMSTKPK